MLARIHPKPGSLRQQDFSRVGLLSMDCNRDLHDPKAGQAAIQPYIQLVETRELPLRAGVGDLDAATADVHLNV